MGEVFQATGTVWENYAPDCGQPGKPAKGGLRRLDGHRAHPVLPRVRIGLKPDAPNNRLTWVLTSKKRCGCERFRFNGHTVTLLAEPKATTSQMQITVESDGAFQFHIVRGARQWDEAVHVGQNVFRLD